MRTTSASYRRLLLASVAATYFAAGTSANGQPAAIGATAPGATPAVAPAKPVRAAVRESDQAAPGHAMEQIVVLAQRTPARIARQAQKEAPNLILVQTYQEIRKLPDISAAEAVRRIPGVSLETDEGEGRYVNIRGFDADLNSTTFGGLRLPPTNNASPFGGYRAVTLDSIPVGLIGALTVTNSNIPEMDAEALGGTIEITPKSAPPGDKPFFIQGDIGTGFEPLRGTGITNDSVTTGGRYGPFSLLVTGSYYEDSRGIDDVEPAYINAPPAPYQAVNNIGQRDYELNRWRHAFGITLGYDPDPNDKYYIRAFDAGYTERYDRQILSITPDGNATQDANGIITDTLNKPGALQKQLRDEAETSIDRIVTVGGRNILDDNNIVDYHVGYTVGTYHKPYDFNSTFSYVPSAGANGTINYSPTGRGNTPLYGITGFDYLNPSKYVLDTNNSIGSFSNSRADNYDRETSAAINYEHKLHLLSADDESIKIGAMARLRHKVITTTPTSYGTVGPLALASIAGSPSETYYDGQYQNGQDIQQTYLQNRYGPGQITPADVISAQQQFLNARENVFSGYAQYQAKWGKLGLLAGIRVEYTEDKLNAYASVIDAAGNTTTSLVSASKAYTNPFPSIQLRYEIQPDFIARLAWSSTIARPGFNQNSAALNVDLGTGQVARGNPNLQPATSDSFDLSFEKYLPQAGIVSIGFFDKEISNYIIANQLLNQTLPGFNFPGNTLPLKVISYANAPTSYARGLEFNYDQHFHFLPGFLGGLGATANYTFVNSSFEIRPGEYSPLPSTSEHTWNLAMYYEKAGLTARLAAYSASADLFAIGSDHTSDVYNATRTFLDFGSTYAVSDNWILYFNAKNLLNTPHTFYQTTENRPIQREFYEQTYQLGVRFDY